MRSLPVLRPGGDDGQQNGFFRRLEAMRFVWLGDDKGPGVGRLLTAPGEKSALPLHHVEHDAGRRRVRRDLLSRQEAEDDDAYRVGIVQKLGNGPVGRKFGLFQRIKHGDSPFLPVRPTSPDREPDVYDPQNYARKLRYASDPEEKGCRRSDEPDDHPRSEERRDPEVCGGPDLTVQRLPGET